MKISKSSFLELSAKETQAELEAINAFTRRKMTAEEVYTFTVKLCDNEVDRDFERFTDDCLEELSALFVGKTGLLDHNWTAGGQLARIYRTEVVTEQGRKNSNGESYRYLKAWAYMPRCDGTNAFIEAIEAGIVKETSVGCAVEERTCSVCGAAAPESCKHIPGREYDGALCHTKLSGAVDAYEWSFVAVPAQRDAGVTKALGFKGGLSELVKSHGFKGYAAEYDELCRKAASYGALMDDMKNEVLRLSLLWDEELSASISKAVSNMEAAELVELKKSLEKKLSAKFPPVCQLPGRDSEIRFDGEEYII